MYVLIDKYVDRTSIKTLCFGFIAHNGVKCIAIF